VIEAGCLSAKRNWTDVGDIVKAYYCAMEKYQPGKRYLIGSDMLYRVQQCLGLLL